MDCGLLEMKIVIQYST